MPWALLRKRNRGGKMGNIKQKLIEKLWDKLYGFSEFDGFFVFCFFSPCILSHGLMNVFWSSQTLIFQSWPPSDSHPSTLSRFLFLVLSVLFVLLSRAYIVPWFQLRRISYLLCILGEAILDFWSRWARCLGAEIQREHLLSRSVCSVWGIMYSRGHSVWAEFKLKTYLCTYL